MNKKNISKSKIINLKNKKLLPAIFSLAILSGFLIFINFTKNPSVYAVDYCTDQSILLDNFDTPIQANINANNIIGSSFNGWSMQNGSNFNIIRVDVTGYSPGPISAQSGNQYIDVAGAADYRVNQFVLTSNGKISASACFTNRDWAPNSNPSYTLWNDSIEILDNAFNIIKKKKLYTF
jgi:hypothetical protein